MQNKAELTDPSALVKGDVEHVWHHLLQHSALVAKEPVIMVEGDGLRLRDIHGREYLDATSGGVWCVNVGYGRKRIAEAVCAQMIKMPYYAATAGNIPYIEFASKLTSLMPGINRVYLSNSGSEANEKAYKMVRAIGHMKHDGHKKTVLYRHRDYHGTTIGALSSTGQQERREWFGPFAPGFAEFPHACCYRCAFGKTYPGCDIDCAKALETVIQQEGPEEVGAVIVEPITAGGGVIPPVAEYYDVLQEICRRHGVLLIMDEVVCGMGRTGKWFGYQHYNAKPDIVTMAKGVASAYMPISVTATTENVFAQFLHDTSDAMAYFRDISTFGGCAAACTAAIENTAIIEEENLLENCRVMGERLLDGLKGMTGLPHVGDVRGKGLLCGIELVEDKKTRQPVHETYAMRAVGEIAAQGVLVGRTNRSLPGHNNIINLAPALCVSKDEIDTILKAVENALVKAAQ
ncbi:MAG: aspartate aminotransferase family protein [Deltaproteobacteria bacterium HGW-Deltaproteobacteria-8]|jgi:taurine-pyruvate aminotransferase|nr:MAG: aspartate aminotransferase family protein [Deltaproteobacteria bacterium HGW-Deltaproteobacteria-8]